MHSGYSKTVLKNGIRVISEHIPTVRSISIGVWLNVGSRDEAPHINGMSHFVEHMLFKGTKNRNSAQIARYLEALGGALNAFTGREYTCYYARVLDENLSEAMEIIGDILNNSTFTSTNLNREKQVIVEEIKDVIDTPQEYIHDLFSELMWDSHPLGKPIMGRSEIITGLKRSDVLRYMDTNYTAGNVVVAAAGNVRHRKLVEMATRYFPWPHRGGEKTDGPPATNGYRQKNFKRNSSQTHVIMGVPSLAFGDRDRFPVLGLNTYLSGGMSSRLFQAVRERAGLCYTIYSYQDFYRDTGVFSVYFAADKSYVPKAIDLTIKELKRLKTRLLTRVELDMVKAQLKGNLMLTLEATNNRMNRIARQELMLERYVDINKTLRLIDAITARQIRDTAQRILQSGHMTVCSLGPTTQKDLAQIDFSSL